MDPNDQKKTACYDIDVEVEDPLKSQMSSFLLSTANQQEIASLDNKVRPLASAVGQFTSKWNTSYTTYCPMPIFYFLAPFLARGMTWHYKMEKEPVP